MVKLTSRFSVGVESVWICHLWLKLRRGVISYIKDVGAVCFASKCRI